MAPTSAPVRARSRRLASRRRVTTVRGLRNRPKLLVIGSALIALLIGAQSVAAATVLSHTGSIGPYSLTDATAPSGHQAVICNYAISNEKLATIVVRRPQVKARNTSSARDSQWVGWQFIVQHETPSGRTWSTISGSSFVKGKAFDNLAAPFTDRTWVGPAVPTGRYRILVVIRWYAPGSTSTIGGQMKLLDQNYESKWNGHAVISQGDCLQDY
jgi:hypothetical protein